MSTVPTMKTYRVVTRAVVSITYEIDCESEEVARRDYLEGVVVRNEWDYDDIESVKQIDVADPLAAADRAEAGE